MLVVVNYIIKKIGGRCKVLVGVFSKILLLAIRDLNNVLLFKDKQGDRSVWFIKGG